MARSTATRSLLGLARGFRVLYSADPLTQCLAPRLCRAYATETRLPVTETASDHLTATTLRPSHSQSPLSLNAFEQPVVATLYQFPSLEPNGYALYHPQFLNAPLRRDILHRAVIFEADGSRQGTASTKWRGDVHGSNRKIQAQKGTGRARVGDKKSPIRRGGGVAFGPHPRDFSTELQAKVYAHAFRVALSYRYRKGELIILDNDVSASLDQSDRWLNNVFSGNRWTKTDGRTLLVTDLTQESYPEIFEKMAVVGAHATLKDINTVDVKDFLEGRRIVIEKDALQTILSPSITGLPPGASENMVRYVEKTL
ncbi:hypothetical protein LTR84_007105 [Exophiala bonariae]|uniref:Large ribosomal subunit protein uL4m n=1 Tax=Exophiala bonariae TaxID=1690606 RepID=A0AAV9MZZ4_9EURO|nr:hypothetical protein LTR84_007105 [Exophiala bonariae]